MFWIPISGFSSGHCQDSPVINLKTETLCSLMMGNIHAGFLSLKIYNKSINIQYKSTDTLFCTVILKSFKGKVLAKLRQCCRSNLISFGSRDGGSGSYRQLKMLGILKQSFRKIFLFRNCYAFHEGNDGSLL